MIIQCNSCQTRYHYDETRFGSASAKKIRCTKCSTVFEIRNPASPGIWPEQTVPFAAPQLGADDFTMDPTEMAAEPRRRPTPLVPPPLPPSVAGAKQTRSTVNELLSTIRSGSATMPAAPPPPMRRQNDASSSTGEFPRAAAGDPDRPLRLPDWYRLSLACIAGPDSGRIFEIEKPKVTIGRSSSDIVLSDSQCSRQHAVIEVADDQAWIVDLGSTNGTFVGERRISREELDNRTEFDVGATTLMFIRTRREG